MRISDWSSDVCSSDLVDYGTPAPNDPERFYMTVTFDEQTDGKTVLTMRQLHPSRERRQVVVGFGAVEYGLQTLDGLATWLDGRPLLIWRIGDRRATVIIHDRFHDFEVQPRTEAIGVASCRSGSMFVERKSGVYGKRVGGRV